MEAPFWSGSERQADDRVGAAVRAVVGPGPTSAGSGPRGLEGAGRSPGTLISGPAMLWMAGMRGISNPPPSGRRARSTGRGGRALRGGTSQCRRDRPSGRPSRRGGGRAPWPASAPRPGGVARDRARRRHALLVRGAEVDPELEHFADEPLLARRDHELLSLDRRTASSSRGWFAPPTTGSARVLPIRTGARSGSRRSTARRTTTARPRPALAAESRKSG
jgi:hypothetical protein